MRMLAGIGGLAAAAMMAALGAQGQATLSLNEAFARAR